MTIGTTNDIALSCGCVVTTRPPAGTFLCETHRTTDTDFAHKSVAADFISYRLPDQRIIQVPFDVCRASSTID